MATRVGFVSLRPDLLKGFLPEVWKEMLLTLKSVTAFKCEIVYLGSVSEISSEEKAAIEKLDIVTADPGIFENKQMFTCLRNLSWVHLWSSGADHIIKHYKDKEKPSFLLTRNKGFFDSQMCQMTISWICGRERHFECYRKNQDLKLWKPLEYRTMDEITIGIVGFGSVGQHLARMCVDWEMSVLAFVREGSQKEDLKNGICNGDDLKNIRKTTDLSNLLSSSDYVISILPSTPQTTNLFDGDVLKHCASKRAVFINLGRGNVVSEDSIIRALDNKWISHALLDVFPVEPLTTESRLWSRDDVSITPHISGRKFQSRKFMKDFEEKYKRFLKGSEIAGTIDWNKMY